MPDGFYETLHGRGPDRIAHYEHWSNPDAETLLTGVDAFAKPATCRARFLELYPDLRVSVPPIADDTPIPRPEAGAEVDSEGHTVRWGTGQTWSFDFGSRFPDGDACLEWSPLENADQRELPIVERHDFRSVEALVEEYGSRIPQAWWKTPGEGEARVVGFYQTMFMWPLLTFGWENFLEICLLDEFEPVMDEFAELSRRVFTAFAQLPYNIVICHDDIVTSRGPVCSPEWMRKYIFPRYEEFWSLLRENGKTVVFMADGCLDQYADDVLACGASGFITEPYTDLRALADRHGDIVLAGEGDNRILTRNDPAEIRGMVERMAETGRRSAGYLMCIGNHISWEVPADAVKRYFDLSDELAFRGAGHFSAGVRPA